MRCREIRRSRLWLPEAFSLSRACTPRHFTVSDLRPSSPPRTDRNRAFRPSLPPDESSEALLHSLQRVPQVRALAPQRPSTQPHKTRWSLLVSRTLLTNIFLPAPLSPSLHRLRCKAQKGEDDEECEKYAKYYRSLCPTDWVTKWNEEREAGTWPGRY